MAEDPLSPRDPPKTLADRLGMTGNKIAELSKQEDRSSTSHQERSGKVADASKEAAGKGCRCKQRGRCKNHQGGG